jgi:hypothetical protein
VGLRTFARSLCRVLFCGCPDHQLTRVWASTYLTNNPWRGVYHHRRVDRFSAASLSRTEAGRGLAFPALARGPEILIRPINYFD